MLTKNIVDMYYEAFIKSSNCKKTNQITGILYSLSGQNEEGQILRYFLDKYLQASISQIKSTKTHCFDYIEHSDLIIIGFCLQGKTIIDHKGHHVVKKGEIIYFRPSEDFKLLLSNHDFLYYYIDCARFKESLAGRNCQDLFCNFHIDYICKKGEIIIKKAPDIIRSHINEIQTLRQIKTNNFLDYAKIKGQLHNYLSWLIGLRLNENPHIDEENCQRHYVSKAKKIIIDHLEDQITVTEIAARLDISTYRLQNYFKELEKTTVYDFILKTKIDNSKVFLKQSHCSILEIAQKVGYENPSKFSTAFKNITGYTPTEYRNLPDSLIG